jgi:hypothetical protein
MEQGEDGGSIPPPDSCELILSKLASGGKWTHDFYLDNNPVCFMCSLNGDTSENPM